MKTYKKAEVEAVNALCGSYAAGCPQKAINESGTDPDCRQCESVK